MPEQALDGPGLPRGCSTPPRQGWLALLTRRLPSLAFAALLSATGLPTGRAANAAETGELQVQVVGLRSDRGVVKAALYDSPASWSRDTGPGAGGAVRLQEAPIRSGTATLRFSGLRFGRYALRAFHDEDRSGTLITGPLGIPKEDVIFSNDVPIWQGLAPFAKASFPIQAPTTSLVLKAQRL